jgi:acylpyruvate hydrolase
MARYATVRTDAGNRAARIEGETATVLDHADVGALLGSGADWRERADAAQGEELAVAGLDLAPVVPAPEKIVCVGLNYREHAAEAGKEIPDYPQLFAKYALALTGPRDEVLMPDFSDQVDWEAELGIVIGRPARRVSEEEALSYVAGYTVVNDVSVRDWQRRTTQYLQGKIFEGSTPAGPWLVCGDEVENPSRLDVSCHLDGETVQEFSTSDMVFGPAYLVSYLSQILTLTPGDLIITGTGPGVGGGRRPQRFIPPGATLRTEIAGIGTLENLCVTDRSGKESGA